MIIAEVYFKDRNKLLFESEEITLLLREINSYMDENNIPYSSLLKIHLR
jgi:hypothetical protein